MPLGQALRRLVLSMLLTPPTPLLRCSGGCIRRRRRADRSRLRRRFGCCGFQRSGLGRRGRRHGRCNGLRRQQIDLHRRRFRWWRVRRLPHAIDPAHRAPVQHGDDNHGEHPSSPASRRRGTFAVGVRRLGVGGTGAMKRKQVHRKDKRGVIAARKQSEKFKTPTRRRNDVSRSAQTVTYQRSPALYPSSYDKPCAHSRNRSCRPSACPQCVSPVRVERTFVTERDQPEREIAGRIEHRRAERVDRRQQHAFDARRAVFAHLGEQRLDIRERFARVAASSCSSISRVLLRGRYAANSNPVADDNSGMTSPSLSDAFAG